MVHTEKSPAALESTDRNLNLTSPQPLNGLSKDKSLATEAHYQPKKTFFVN